MTITAGHPPTGGTHPPYSDGVLTTQDGLPYARPFRRRCHDRLGPNPGGYWGRCELEPHPDGTEHALERGMLIIRWGTLLRAEGP